jgi:hypothetical protein
MSKMSNTPTGRGFAAVHFDDTIGVPCTMQKSSAICKEALVWLGPVKDRITATDTGEEIDRAEVAAAFDMDHFCVNTRMHLTQSQVHRLMPVLAKFAAGGETFAPVNFSDAYGTACTLHRKDKGIVVGTVNTTLAVGFPWTKVSLSDVAAVMGVDGIALHTLMHLSQADVKHLLGPLEQFAEDGTVGV